MLHPPRRTALSALVPVLLLAAAGCGPSGVSSADGSASGAGSSGPGPDHAPYEGTAFPNRRTPLSVPAGGLAIVADGLTDKLVLLDLAAGKQTGLLPVGNDPVTIDGPANVAADLDGGWLFVLLTYPDLPSGAQGPHADHTEYDPPGYVQKLALSDLSITGEVQVNVEPSDLAVAADGGRLVTLHPFEDQLENALIDPTNLDWYRGRMEVVDPATIRPLLSDEPLRVRPCLAPRRVVLSRPDGAFAYVACYGEDVIAIVDLASGSAPVERIAVAPEVGAPGSPEHGPSLVSLSPDGAIVAFANELTHTIGFLDLDDRTIDAGKSLATAGRPVALAHSADGAWLYVVTHDPPALLRFEAKSGKELSSRVFVGAECASPSALSATPQGSLVMVCPGVGSVPGKLLLLDVLTLDTVSAIAAGLGPTSFVILPGSAL